MRIIQLPPSPLHTNNFQIVSQFLTLNGQSTTLSHSPLSPNSKRTQPELQRSNGKDSNIFSTLLGVANSTVFINRVNFVTGDERIIIATIHSSTVQLASCSIHAGSELSPFLFVDNSNNERSSLLICSCKLHPQSGHVLPPLANYTSPSLTNHFKQSESTFPTPSVSTPFTVSAVDVSIANTHISPGTGPLFAFDHTNTILSSFLSDCTFDFSYSSILNSTSSPQVTVVDNHGQAFKQRIMQCHVSKCSNSLYGTACLDINRGGSFLCSNTSFMKCRNDAFSLQDHHQYQNENPLIYDVSGKYDSMLFYRCTFKGISSTQPGGAVHILNASQSITFEDNSFLECTSENEGGSLYINMMTEGELNLIRNTFASCNSDSNGGSVSIRNGLTIAISDCFFFKSTAYEVGGGVYVLTVSSAITISNCAFVLCKAEGGFEQGGGCSIKFGSLTLTSVQFRNCSAAQGGHDFYTDKDISTLTSNVFVNCDTNSGDKRVMTSDGETADHLIPQIQDSIELSSIEFTRRPDDSINVTATVSSPSLNTIMLVLVSNENKTTQTGLPNIQRLISFSFSSSPTSAVTQITTGPQGILQENIEEYAVVSATVAGYIVTGSVSLKEASSPPPPLVGSAVFAREGGVDDWQECGEFETPCSSISTAWLSAQNKDTEAMTEMRVIQLASFVSCIEVRSKELTITSASESSSAVVVIDSSLSCPTNAASGAVWVNEGTVSLFSLVLRLPSSSSFTGAVPPRFVLAGRGSITILSVTLSQLTSGVGVGLVSADAGQVDVENCMFDDLKLEEGQTMIQAVSQMEDVQLNLNILHVSNTDTTNAPLIEFSSSSIESKFTLTKSVFLNTRRVQSTSTSARTPLISVETAQKTLEMETVTIEGSGCLKNGEIAGNAVLIVLSPPFTSPTPTSQSITLTDWFILDSFSSSDGAVVVSSGHQIASVALVRMWVEDTTVTNNDFPRIEGVPVRDETIRAVRPTTSSKVGVLVECKSQRPIVVRRQCGFSACQLKSVLTN